MNLTQHIKGISDTINTKMSKVASSVLLNQSSLTLNSGVSLTVTDGNFHFTKGKDKYGFLMDAKTYTGSIDFTGIDDGIKYIGLQEDNTVVAYDGVSIGSYEKQSADDNRLVFNTEDGKWYEEVGAELVTNGTFDTDTSGWYDGINGGVASWNSGVLRITNGASSYGRCYTQVNGLEVGQKYKLTFEPIGGTGSTNVRVGTSVDASDLGFFTSSVEINFAATSTTVYIGLGANTNIVNQYYEYDNISVYKVEPTLSALPIDPISFLPYPIQVQSETPQAIMYDMERIPENVMGGTMVDGDLEVNGEIKGSTINIQDLPTVDPFVDGELWNSSNTIKLSVGA